MKNLWIGATVVSMLALAAPVASAGTDSETTKCEMDFHLKSWSFGYTKADGEGVITCDNGEKADVRRRSPQTTAPPGFRPRSSMDSPSGHRRPASTNRA